MTNQGGGFTIPGESGYEKLTLELAKKWGADAIRDSDGTSLSQEINEAGYDIYSTVCVIRGHNEWIKQNPQMQQQTFLITSPAVATSENLKIALLGDFFEDHVSVNDSPQAMAYWQVTNRTTGQVLKSDSWSYKDGTVVIENAVLWNTYTVSFLAWRIWEEISMYNHTTNNWDSEHLMQLDPVYPQAQEYLLDWMDKWCAGHSATEVVRFTSLFYNFTWIWGSHERLRNVFTDWGCYVFAVSPLMLENFRKQYGYTLTAEDFVNGGKYRTTHMPPDSRLRDWMDFVSAFVADFAKKLVDVVHRHQKQAYVFYDDCWIGLEPYGKHFASIGFDGIIKCVFSGYESRLCSDVKGVDTHEIRLHPYLFPVGLGGAPTFSEGGNPARDAMEYWVAVRRAILRSPVDRIGLGGYLSLTLPFPEFNDAIAEIAEEFRILKQLHSEGAPSKLRPAIGVLTAWGSLRSWTCCGHYHENPENDLINLIESLSGLAFDVRFLSFDDIRSGVPEDINVIINAGFAGSAWSGGAEWHSEHVTALTAWTHQGGVLLGVGEPSALCGNDTFFRMAQVLGVDIDTGERVNHGRWSYEVSGSDIRFEGAKPHQGIYLTNANTQVLGCVDNLPVFTTHKFGSGLGVYLASYRHSAENASALKKLILETCGCEDICSCPDPGIECATFPNSKQAVVINNSPKATEAAITHGSCKMQVKLKPYGMAIVEMNS